MGGNPKGTRMATGVPWGWALMVAWHPQTKATGLSSRAAARLRGPSLCMNTSKIQRVDICLVNEERRSQDDLAAAHRKLAQAAD